MKKSIIAPKRQRAMHNLSSICVTTTDLMKMQPIMAREYVPNDHFRINLHQVNRFSPIAVPSFVNVSTRNSWFAINYQQIWNAFEAFITQDNYTSESGQLAYLDECPYVKNSDFRDLFKTERFLTTEYDKDHKPSVYDFIGSTGSSPKYYTFTPRGKRFYTLLLNLGYRINFTESMSSIEDVHQNLLPLYAYFFVFYSYYYPKKDGSARTMRSHLEKFRLSTTLRYWNYSNSSCREEMNYWAEEVTKTYLGEDYFTSALLNPIGQSYYTPSFNMKDTTGDSDSPVVYADGNQLTPQIEANGSQLYYGSEFIHNMVTNLTRFLQKRNIVGTDTAERLMALAGTRGNANPWLPKLIKTENLRFKVQDIVSTSETLNASGEGASLGENGGRMNGECDCHVEFTADKDNKNYGVLICVNNIICDYFYCDGLHREMQHTKPLDFFTPEFENEGIQAINQAEVRYSNRCQSLGNYKPTDVFGYTNRYAEYKTGKSCLSGDFAIPTSGAEMGTAWHHARYFDPMNIPTGSTMSEMKPDITFAVATSDYPSGNAVNAYDRIFVDANASDDHIQQMNFFDVSAVRDMRSIGDYTIGDESGEKFVVHDPQSHLNQ